MSTIFELILDIARDWKVEFDSSDGRNNPTAAARFAVEEEINRRLKEKDGAVHLQFSRSGHMARVGAEELRFTVAKSKWTSKPKVVLESQVKHEGGWLPFMDWKMRFRGRDLQRVLRTPLNAAVDRGLQKRIDEITRKGLDEGTIKRMAEAVVVQEHMRAKAEKAKAEKEKPGSEPKPEKAKPKAPAPEKRTGSGRTEIKRRKLVGAGNARFLKHA